MQDLISTTILNSSNLDDYRVDSLRQAVEEYPFFSLARLLLIKSKTDKNHTSSILNGLFFSLWNIDNYSVNASPLASDNTISILDSSVHIEGLEYEDDEFFEVEQTKSQTENSFESTLDNSVPYLESEPDNDALVHFEDQESQKEEDADSINYEEEEDNSFNADSVRDEIFENMNKIKQLKDSYLEDYESSKKDKEEKSKSYNAEDNSQDSSNVEIEDSKESKSSNQGTYISPDFEEEATSDSKVIEDQKKIMDSIIKKEESKPGTDRSRIPPGIEKLLNGDE